MNHSNSSVARSESFGNGTSGTNVEDIVYFNLIYPPIFLAVGVPGNIFSMVIWLRRVRNSPGSTCLILSILCAVDTYVLIHGCLRIWLKAIGLILNPARKSHFDLRYILGCAPPLYIFTFTSDLSVWLIILLCAERFICAWFPMQMKTICHWRRGAVCLAITVAILAILNTPLLVLITSSSAQKACIRANFSVVYVNIWSYFDFAIYSLIPLALIIFTNVLILIKLQASARVRQSSQQNRSARILRTIVCMCICHFLLTMPIVIYFLANSACPDTSGARNICDSLNELFIMLQLANHLTHFFIYSCTSTLFKADLMNMCVPWRFRAMPSNTDGTTGGGMTRGRMPRKSQLFAEFEHRDQSNGLIPGTKSTTNDETALALGEAEKTSDDVATGRASLLEPPPTPV